MATHPQRDGFSLFLLGVITFAGLGFVLMQGSQSASVDFAGVYFPARCFLAHGDPYEASQVKAQLAAQGGAERWAEPLTQRIITTLPYPPSVLPLVLPFALLPWPAANVLWTLITAACLILATYVTWKSVAADAPLLGGVLAGLVIANCEVVLILGNPAGIATSLCVIAVCCFLNSKWGWAGVVCLAVSLALKPHDAAFLWVYCLLAGGDLRRRALQTVAAFAALTGPTVIWLTVRVPGWLHELLANLKSFAVHGGMTDPGPASVGNHGLGSMVNLQSAFAFVRDEPTFYKSASYAVAALVAWMLLWALRGRRTPQSALMLTAAFAAFTLLPIYHHLYDAKILLLLIPACLWLWKRASRLRIPALLLTAAALVCTGDFFWTLLLLVSKAVPAAPGSLVAGLITGAQMVPVPLVLLVVCVFYAWAARHADVCGQTVEEGGA